MILLLLGCGLYGQNSGVKASQVRFYYDAVRYEEAVKAGQEVLQADSSLGLEQLQFVHRYMALSFFNLGQQDSARSHFLSLLSLAPQAELDPVTTSPKIIDFFEETRSKQALNMSQSAVPFSRYLVQPDRRPSATWRSMLLPGWGQVYKNQNSRGLLFGGVFLSSAAATGMAWWRESSTHDRYLESSLPEDIRKNYDSYNKWYKTRRNLAVATAVVWGVSVADALWSGSGTPHAALSRDGDLQFGLAWRW